jgi:hypothetical protein
VNDELLIRLFKRHFVDPEAALHRLEAHLAAVDLPFNLKIQLRELQFPTQPKLPHGLPPLIYYFVPNSRRGTDQSPHDDPLHPSFVNASDGLGLNFGCPVRLLRAFDALGRLSLHDQQQPRAGLRNAPEHLSAVEELLWLHGWKPQTWVRRGGQFAGMTGDVDWAFEVGGATVFLEAKFRRSDWSRLSDANTFSHLGDGFLSSALHKFPHPAHGVGLHVVGITTFANIDENIMRGIGRELEAAPQIHAVVIRSLIQMTHVISLDVKVRNCVRKLLLIPAINDYPINHGVFFDRQERDKRIARNSPKINGANSVKVFSWSIEPVGNVPFPVPDSGAYRLDIPSRGPDGEPQFKVIPKYMRDTGTSTVYKPTSNYVAGREALEVENLQKALAIFSTEPVDSPSYGLALANKALVELRMDRYAASEATGKLALVQFAEHGCPQLPNWVQAFRVLGESISLQDRIKESLTFFVDGCHLANHLIADFPDHADDLLLQKAYTLNSWGGALIKNYAHELAIVQFAEARDIYRKYPQNSVGCVETLTNLALAYSESGDKMSAALAISEARDSVGNDRDQIHRINTVAARLGLFSKDETRRLLLDAARDAANLGKFETAYIRHCVAGSLAGKWGDPVWGMEVVHLAEALEQRLSAQCLHPAKLSFYKATFLEISDRPIAEILEVLLAGARIWCEKLPGPLGLEDYQSAVSLMHDHFRKLSAKLLQVGRTEEGFVAFETGRARSFAMEIKGNRRTFLDENPFRAATVERSLLTRVQAGLKSDEIFISIAVLPPDLVAFIVGRDGLQVRVVGLVANLPEADAFWKTISAIPTNLEHSKGPDSFPPQVLEIGKMIVEAIGTRKLAVLAPHALLHKVPWRMVLHTFGVAWHQLSFVTQFSPILDPDKPIPDVSLPSAAIALGFGIAGSGQNTINLEDEAKDFANAFSPNGRICVRAKSHDVAAALKGNDIVLLSCHGEMTPPDQGNIFHFVLANGRFAVDDLVDSAIKSPLVILSACSSGAYEMAVGDYPIGTAPLLLVAGAQFCICNRYPISAHFAKSFFPSLGRRLSLGQKLADAFTSTMQEMEEASYDQWRHLACVELLGRGTEGPKALAVA